MLLAMGLVAPYHNRNPQTLCPWEPRIVQALTSGQVSNDIASSYDCLGAIPPFLTASTDELIQSPNKSS
jgi:hypothetical protein